MSLLLNPYAYATSAVPAWAEDWWAAYQTASASGGQAHVLCVGDSVTQGFYATDPYHVNGWAGVLKSELATATGVAPGTGIIYVDDEFTITDARTSVTGTWSTQNSSGYYQRLRLGNAGATFTLGPIDCSAFRIYYAVNSGGAAWTATVDGGTPENFTSLPGTVGPAIAEVDAGGQGSHTLVITASANFCYLAGVEALSNVSGGVRVSKLARSAQRADQFTTKANAISSGHFAEDIDCDLALVAFGLNETVQSYSPTTFRTNLGTVATQLRTANPNASVAYVVVPTPDPSTYPLWQDYVDQIYLAAGDVGAGVIDVGAEFGGYQSSLMHDALHPNNTGHSQFGQFVTSSILF